MSKLQTFSIRKLVYKEFESNGGIKRKETTCSIRGVYLLKITDKLKTILIVDCTLSELS